MSAGVRCEMPFGAQVLGDGRVRFRLWAPACEQVWLELDDESLPLTALGDGFHERLVETQAGCRYRYRIDDQRRVPDPASRLQAGDVHDASVVVDAADYRWQHADWRGRPWAQSVIMEVHAGTLGGFDGVRAQLPRLAALGITAIELMPIADFSGRRNWGYDGVLPFAPDTRYGTPAALRALVDGAHGLGLCVYLDVVYNHFGPEGNYLGAYAPECFSPDQHTPWGAALDFNCRPLREFFISNALYWLSEYRFDGLRLDAVHAIGERDFLIEFAARLRAATAGREIHLMLENLHNDAGLLGAGLDAQWNDDVHHALHVLLTGEQEGYYADFAGAPAAYLARCLGEGFAWQGEPSPALDDRPRGSPSAHLPPSAFVFFLQNHDQIGNRAFGERLLTLADPAAWHAALALQLLCPQVPLLFMGEELGATTPFLYFTDFSGELAAAVCAGRRREFAGFAAFADAGRRHAIPDPNAETTFTASCPRPGSAAVAECYRTLLALRQRELAPRLAGSVALAASECAPQAVCAQWRLGDGSRLQIVANFAAASVPLTPPHGALLYESTRGAAARLALGELPAHSTCAYLESNHRHP